MSDSEKMMQLISMLIQRNDILEVKIDNLKEFTYELRDDISKLNMKLEKDIYEIKTKIDFLAARAGCVI